MRIGVDAGGTFTDFAVLHGDGRLESFKLRSNPAAPAAVILEGIARASGGRRAEAVHGSTVATNALLERKGARTAFITTEGFTDLIFIGRQNRPQLYNLTPPLRRFLIPPSLCFGVSERTFIDGGARRRPGKAELESLKRKLRRAGVSSAAICFLHSYHDAANEKAAAEALRGSGLYLSVSHEVVPEYREYERASTTLINAYVGPLMDAYLGELEGHDISIMQSNGGHITAGEARRQAVRTILSGPAGGVVGAAAAARAGGFRRVLGFDMGGTSTDVSLADGSPRMTTEATIDGLPIRVPALDIHTVGAGGGSLARVDEGGLLRVGPESAGADPGPACYGKGEGATVTDAHVVLGRIAADQFLGGQMRIEVERSAAAVDRIAAQLGADRVAAAEGILRVANANMERAIRVVSVERGHDPRDFALVAFGGCGGLHACEIAGELGIGVVVIPQMAGALSALGMLVADRVRDYSASALQREDMEKRFRELERAARADMPGCRLERSADVRYRGQSYELNVPWQPSDFAAPFHALHEKIYGYADRGRRAEIVTVRVKASIGVNKPAIRRERNGTSEANPPRRMRIAGRWLKTPVYRRGELSGRSRPGPALIIDYGSTTLIPPNWRFHLDRAGNVIARLSLASKKMR
ncbi:MAG TPA: hydantoinase/oxoprolinase family protein [Bryobacteraceae bacterium]|jgi:N-methylhydantoinase A/oxoprolinase/acetone carboxylase beta subunit|nr:hydantoinase/oxoprolinase family protein [Bryobacteraceae bacterium]